LLVSGPVAQEKQGIWMISVIGATLKKLRDDAYDASLSPDGSQIVFRDANTRDIWLMAADGSQAHLFLKPDEGYHLFRPTWFPSGKRVSYSMYKLNNGQLTIRLESRDRNGADPVLLLSNGALSDVFWGQRGRLIYAANEPPPNQYDANLWELRFDEDTGKPKGEPRRLTDWTGFSFNYPELTADGKRLVFLNARQQSDVYIGELGSGGNELKPPQRLSLDERLDWPGGWSPDSKTIFMYTEREGSFDIYKQGLNDRNAQPVVTSPEEKWVPRISPDGKWVLYMQWSKTGARVAVESGKLMRAAVSGGPPEVVMDIKGYPASASGGDVGATADSYPSFRCPNRPAMDCVLAESNDKQQVAFTAFDPVKGRKNALATLPKSDFMRWDLSPDGTRIAASLFDYKKGEVQIVSLPGGAIQKLSAAPWTELATVAWAADGKSLFLASYSSRGTAIVHMDLNGQTKMLFKPAWDIFSLSPSPDGHYLAFGPIITNANAWTIASFPGQ
jgi:Tol biopolymer transport system component